MPWNHFASSARGGHCPGFFFENKACSQSDDKLPSLRGWLNDYV